MRSRQPPPTRSRPAEAGIGLVDLQVLLAIFAVICLAALGPAREVLQTHRRNAATRRVMAEIRATQSLAVTRHGVFGFHWGGDPGLSGNAAAYRIVRDATGSCAFPPTSQAQDGTNVVFGWFDLGQEYPGVRIDAIRDGGGSLVGGVMFDTKGASVNTCTSATFPIRVSISDASGQVRVIEISAAGGTSLQ